MSKLQEYKQVRDIYDKIAPDFNRTRLYTWNWVDNFINSISIGSTIYDIGCGNGRNMTNKNYKFIGLDNCSSFVSMCQSCNLNVVQGDMTELPFEDKSADAILSIASFHHLQTEKRRLTALKEMKRVLRPKGKILLTIWSKIQPSKTRRVFEKYGDVMVPWNTKGKIYERYYYIYQLEEIKKMFEKAGLKIISHKWECGNEVYVLS